MTLLTHTFGNCNVDSNGVIPMWANYVDSTKMSTRGDHTCLAGSSMAFTNLAESMDSRAYSVGSAQSEHAEGSALIGRTTALVILKQ